MSTPPPTKPKRIRAPRKPKKQQEPVEPFPELGSTQQEAPVLAGPSSTNDYGQAESSQHTSNDHLAEQAFKGLEKARRQFKLPPDIITAPLPLSHVQTSSEKLQDNMKRLEQTGQRLESPGVWKSAFGNMASQLGIQKDSLNTAPLPGSQMQTNFEKLQDSVKRLEQRVQLLENSDWAKSAVTWRNTRAGTQNPLNQDVPTSRQPMAGDRAGIVNVPTTMDGRLHQWTMPTEVNPQHLAVDPAVPAGLGGEPVGTYGTAGAGMDFADRDIDFLRCDHDNPLFGHCQEGYDVLFLG